MASGIVDWDQDVAHESFEQVPMSINIKQVSKTTYSKRKHSGHEKPRKILRTGSNNASYDRPNEAEERCQEEQDEQRFSEALDLIATEIAPLYCINSNQSSTPINYLDKKPHGYVSVDTEAVAQCDLGLEISLANDPSNRIQTSSRYEMDNVAAPQQTSVQYSDDDCTSEEEPSLGPHVLGLVPVQNPPRSIASPTSNGRCNCHGELEQKISTVQRQLTLLQNKYGTLHESHEKLAQLVEAQNHLLACHSAPPPTREALANFPVDESEFVKLPEATMPVSEATGFARVREAEETEKQLKLPRKVTAKDIIRLWEEGSRFLPPVKNWTPAQKMKVQSKLSRWKKIIDIFKTDCSGDMENFERRYSGDDGELLPVTTILALHENQLSSEFLSKGFRNTKMNTIDLASPVECKKEFDDETDVENPETATTMDEVTPVKDEGEKTNRYVLPRKVTARDVVHLWDSGCDDFPAIGTWSKAQKIGQETKIFRWRKIVDIFKKDCDSDWHVFATRYSNDKGELLPLATILAKHDAIYAQDQSVTSKPTVGSEANDTKKATPKTPIKTENNQSEKTQRDPDCVTLPRKVTAYEVVHYWTEGCESFGPVKDWTRTQKMGQETKISRWKKIYEIFRYQCCRDWDEFCRRYTNQRGELLPVATILGKYEAENPAGVPSYKLHGKRSPESLTPVSTGTDVDFDMSIQKSEIAEEIWTLPHPENVVISVNENGEFVLPAKLSPIDALSLWEHGTDQAPPLKECCEEQVQQKPRFASIRHLAEIFEGDCGGELRRFVERFSDTDGELLPIAGILYSSDSRKYSPCFTEYEKSIKQSRSKGEQYELPKRVSAKEIVWLWEHGCRDFPPVKAWSSAQKLRYTTKLSRWRKIVEIFHTKCDGNWRIYEEKYSNENGELVAISTVISMQEDTNVDSYASMIKTSINSPGPSGKRWSSTESPLKKNAEKVEASGEGDFYMNGDHSESNDDSSMDFHLPRKVNALDIINFWESGLGDMPPVAQWSALQRFRQRSKISRWSKIYDIYKNHCKADIVEFEKLYSDKDGQLLPVTTIISMYESRVDAESCNGGGRLVKEVAYPSGPVVRRYVLPRKVDAKDIVRMWDVGSVDFPPISSWSKADKIGQETKIFRWKKIVDIFKNHCSSDWSLFEELFSNEYGELLPTSAIIARYETTCMKD